MKKEMSPAAATQEMSRFFVKVFGWMFCGLILSGLTAYFVSLVPQAYGTILFNRAVFIGLIIFELILVGSLIGFMEKMSARLAVLLFLFYCFVNGLTFSVIFLAYELPSIMQAFFVSAGMFGCMSIYGYITKTDLTYMGHVWIMGLCGLVLASAINLYHQSALADYIIAIAGVLIFTGLTAYDTQKIRKANIIGNEGTQDDAKEAIIGALTLYLDFVNVFLNVLRLMGKRKR